MTQEQAANIKALADEVGKPVKDITEYFAVKSLDKVPAAQYQSIIKSLEKRRES